MDAVSGWSDDGAKGAIGASTPIIQPQRWRGQRRCVGKDARKGGLTVRNVARRIKKQSGASYCVKDVPQAFRQTWLCEALTALSAQRNFNRLEYYSLSKLSGHLARGMFAAR